MKETVAQQKKDTPALRQFLGEVIKKSGEKTIRVRVKTIVMHPKYRKQYTTAKMYLVHDEHAVASAGDVVVFAECRPLSKRKRWRLINVL